MTQLNTPKDSSDTQIITKKVVHPDGRVDLTVKVPCLSLLAAAIKEQEKSIKDDGAKL